MSEDGVGEVFPPSDFKSSLNDLVPPERAEKPPESENAPNPPLVTVAGLIAVSDPILPNAEVGVLELPSVDAAPKVGLPVDDEEVLRAEGVFVGVDDPIGAKAETGPLKLPPVADTLGGLRNGEDELRAVFPKAPKPVFNFPNPVGCAVKLAKAPVVGPGELDLNTEGDVEGVVEGVCELGVGVLGVPNIEGVFGPGVEGAASGLLLSPIGEDISASAVCEVTASNFSSFSAGLANAENPVGPAFAKDANPPLDVAELELKADWVCPDPNPDWPKADCRRDGCPNADWPKAGFAPNPD